MFFDIYNEEMDLMANEGLAISEDEVLEAAEGKEGNISEALELVVESLNEFNVLQEKMMKLEHHAIVSENAALLEEGKEGFMLKMKEAIKQMWTKVLGLIAAAKKKIVESLDFDKKFIEKHKDVLMKNSAKVKAYKWDMNKLDAIKNTIEMVSMNDKLDDKNALSSASTTVIKEEIRGKEKVEMTLNGADAVKYLADFKKDTKDLDALKKSIDKKYSGLLKMLDTKSQDGSEVSKIVRFRAAEASKLCGVYLELIKERRADYRLAATQIIKNSKGTKANNGTTVVASESANVLDLY